jgi:hypothetical protein
MSRTKDQPYEVGYAKPPRATQFQKGQSGNPLGRPETHKSVNARIKTELDSDTVAVEDGEQVVVTKREALVRLLVKRALEGDARALEILLQRARENEPEEDLTPIILFEESQAGQPQPDDSGSEAASSESTETKPFDNR